MWNQYAALHISHSATVSHFRLGNRNQQTAGSDSNRSTGRWFGVFAEERKNIWHPCRDHAAMISAGDLVIFVRHVQFLQLVGPSPRIGNRNGSIGITLNN